jgi:hypothetical protein
LRNDQEFSIDILEAQVQFSLAVVEDAQLDNLPGHPLKILDGVVARNGHQGQEAFPYAGDAFSVDDNVCSVYSLQDSSHETRLSPHSIERSMKTFCAGGRRTLISGATAKLTYLAAGVYSAQFEGYFYGDATFSE